MFVAEKSASTFGDLPDWLFSDQEKILFCVCIRWDTFLNDDFLCCSIHIDTSVYKVKILSSVYAQHDAMRQHWPFVLKIYWLTVRQ